MNSSWTGRAARSMQMAFGPYTDNRLQPMYEPRASLWFRLLAWITGQADKLETK